MSAMCIRVAAWPFALIRQTGADSLNAPIMSAMALTLALNRRSSLPTRENHRMLSEPVDNSTICGISDFRSWSQLQLRAQLIRIENRWCRLVTLDGV